MKALQQDLKAFLKQYGRELCFVSAVLTLALFHFLFSSNLRIDSIIKLVSLGDEFNDLVLGRFGMVFLNRLLGQREYNVYFVAFLTLVMLIPVGGLMSFMIWRSAGRRCGRFACLLPLLVYITPNWTEHFYFSYQTFLMTIGLLSAELAACVAEYGDNWLQVAPAALLAFVAFSLYQAFAPLYVALAVGMVLLRCLCIEDMKGAFVWRSALRHMAVFVAALAAWYVTDKILHAVTGEHTTYLTSQIVWGAQPIPGVVMSIVRSVTTIVLAEGNLDTVAYSVSALCSLALMIALLVQRRQGIRSVLALLAWLGLQLTAFAMIIVLGIRTYIRAEMSITFVVAFNFTAALLSARLLAGNIRKESKWLRWRKVPAWAALALAAVCLYVNAGVSFRLMYTDDVRYSFDHTLANRVIERLEPLDINGEQAKKVVFIGEPEVVLNQGCIEGEAIGQSLFQYHTNMEDTNVIIATLLTAHGLTYSDMKTEDMLRAHEVAKEMPDWPAEGSVRDEGDMVVVRFSEDYYFESELLKPGVELSEETVALKDDCVCRLESVDTDGEMVRLRGFSLLLGVDSREIRNTIYLRGADDGELYSVNSACEQKILLTKMYQSGDVRYDAGAVVAMLPLSLLDEHPEKVYEVLVRSEYGDRVWFTSTGSYISKRIVDKIPETTIAKGFMWNKPLALLTDAAETTIAKGFMPYELL